MKEKLKSLKKELKNWNTEVFEELDQNIKALVDNIKALDLRSEEVGLSPNEEVVR